MDITPTIINTIAATTPHTTTTTSAKSPEPETETPTRIQPSKPFPSSNGVLKRHQPHQHHHHHHHLLPHHLSGQQFPPLVYKECLKNHAASLGGHAVDGCGEFMPSPSATSTDPTSLKCAACGCHRNFHRREPEDQPIVPATHVLEFQPHHRHHPLPPQPLPAPNRSPNSASPPPISSSYFPSAPHMLLALSSGLSAPHENVAPPSHALVTPSSSTRKRFRTKFSQEQKDKMYQFAERVGWKMQKRDDDLVQEFCNEIGVDRGVLKVWMHNNKNTLGKRDFNGNRSIHELEREHEHITHNNEMDENNIPNNSDNNGSSLDPNHYQNDNGANIGTNGSSSSS